MDPRAIAIARGNAEKAEVDGLVRFEVADAAAFARTERYGRVVTNPPYGERIMERGQAEALYRSFGQAAAHLPPGWQVSVLSSHTEFERAFGKPADKKRKLYNGMIKCELYQYARKDSVWDGGRQFMRHVFIVNPMAGKYDRSGRWPTRSRP